MRQFIKYHLAKHKPILQVLLRAERLCALLIKPKVLISFFRFRKKQKPAHQASFGAKLKDMFPITGEDTVYTSFDRHYVYHTSWVARVIKEISDSAEIITKIPFRHTDISSSLYVSGLVSAFVPVDFYDYRPADLRLSNLTTNKGDLMHLPFEDRSLVSISCLHTIEHIGLGRYGDPIDPDGDTKAIKELMRVTAPSGSLLIVVPVGRQRIEFNAHRIYNPQYLVDLICEDNTDGKFSLKEYAYIPETDAEGGLMRGASLDKGAQDRYACGCFWFIRNE